MNVAFVHARTDEMTAETPSTDIKGKVTEPHDPAPRSPFLSPVPVTSRRGAGCTECIQLGKKGSLSTASGIISLWCRAGFTLHVCVVEKEAV